MEKRVERADLTKVELTAPESGADVFDFNVTTVITSETKK